MNKKILSFFAICLLLILITGCGTKSETKDARLEILNGTFIIEDKEYYVDNLNDQLVNNGWIADDYSTIKLQPNVESIVNYRHSSYGTELMDFSISVFYYNNTNEEIDILEADVKTILISRRNVEKYPTFGLKPQITSNSSIDDVKKICQPNTIDGNWIVYNGDTTSKVKQATLVFDDDKILQSIELNF